MDNPTFVKLVGGTPRGSEGRRDDKGCVVSRPVEEWRDRFLPKDWRGPTTLRPDCGVSHLSREGLRGPILRSDEWQKLQLH